ARQAHRPADVVPLLEDLDIGSELPRPCCRREAGHPGPRDDQLGHFRAKPGLCSTYSIRIPYGPVTNTAQVFAASTSSYSSPRSRALSTCSLYESTSSARWFSSGRSPAPFSPPSTK